MSYILLFFIVLILSQTFFFMLVFLFLFGGQWSNACSFHCCVFFLFVFLSRLLWPRIHLKNLFTPDLVELCGVSVFLFFLWMLNNFHTLWLYEWTQQTICVSSRNIDGSLLKRKKFARVTIVFFISSLFSSPFFSTPWKHGATSEGTVLCIKDSTVMTNSSDHHLLPYQ